MNRMVKVLSIFLLIILLSGCKSTKDNTITLIASNYPGYDFLRAVTKDVDVNISMLLKPGSDTHSFDPTPKDIINIEKSKLFIYVGGESDEWIDDILDDIDIKKTRMIKMMDLVNTVVEEKKEGMETDEDEEEYDEHVWTNPLNVIKIVNVIKDELIDIDPNNSNKYILNAENYIKELDNIDSEIRDIIKSSKRKELIFGDRFPFRYFVDEYKLDYYAAFPGCSDQTEASAKTISFLINKVKSDKIPVVLHIELSNGKIAKTIGDEAGIKVLELNSAHNISQEDFDKGITYIDIMKNNIEVLKEALQ